MAGKGDKNGAWLRESKSASATHNVEKSPHFRASLGRLPERVGERLGAAIGAPITADSGDNRNARAFAALNEHVGQPAVLIYSDALDARMAMLFEDSAVGQIISAMFGVEAANDDEPASPPERPTGLELRMLREIANAFAQALCDAFAPVADFDLAPEKSEVVEDDGLLGAKDTPALLSPLTVKAPAGAFGVTLLMPHPFLTALAAALARGPAPGATKLDPVWSSRMEQRVTEANLTLTAILDEFQMTLSDVSSLRIGHVLPLSEEGGQGRVRIESGERGVFVCSLGERGGRYALKIEDIIAKAVEGPYPSTQPSA